MHRFPLLTLILVLVTADFAAAQDALLIPEGHRAFALRVPKQHVESVLPGVRVDVLHKEGKNATVVVKNVLVLAVDQIEGMDPTVTVAVRPDDAKRLAVAKGKLSVQLRAPK